MTARMRRVVVSAMALGCLTVLAACSDAAGDGSPDSPGASPSAGAATGAGTTGPSSAQSGPGAPAAGGGSAGVGPGGSGGGSSSGGAASGEGAADRPVVVTEGNVPSPAATLSPPLVPPAAPGVATANPVVLPQWVPPDITMSGIAVAVAGTRYTPGQTIQIASQAAKELTGFTGYILMARPDGSVVPMATGTVGPGGAFTLGYQPDQAAKIITAVAQAGVKPTDPFNIDDVVARSSVIEVAPA